MNKRELNETIRADLFRYSGELSFLKCLVLYPGFRFTYILRKCQYYKSKKHCIVFYIVYRLLLIRYTFKYGYEIGTQTKIGKGLYINHLGGIVINPEVTIGNNINITKGITIGQTNRGERKGVPIIGDMVWIGANASIVGKITIGNNVLIAPNAYVNFDVPSNSVVIGNPAKIINRIDATKDYINRVV